MLQESLKGWFDSLQAGSVAEGRALTHCARENCGAVRSGTRLRGGCDKFGRRGFPALRTEGNGRPGTGRQGNLVASVENNPAILYTLRAGSCWPISSSSAAWRTSPGTWRRRWYLLLIPVGVSATRQFAELMTRGVAEAARRVRSHRESLVTTSLSTPLATWLTGGLRPGAHHWRSSSRCSAACRIRFARWKNATAKIAAMQKPKPALLHHRNLQTNNPPFSPKG